MQPIRNRPANAAPARPAISAVDGGLAPRGRSCVTIMEIDEEEGRLWDAIVEQRGGRR